MRGFACKKGCGALRLAALAAMSVGASPAWAANLSWANGAGGSASIAGNWAPAQVPTAADALTFNMAGAFGVTFNAATTASQSQAYRQGTVTLTMSAAHTTSGGVAIADLTGDVATVTLTTGSWSSGPAGFVNIGDAAGTTGTFNVNDDDADFFVTGTSDLFVGNNGTGTLNITGGGSVTLADTLHVGQGSAATGTLTVSGFVPSVPFPISRLDVQGLGESRWGNGGDATVNVSNGALASFDGDLVIGNLSTSVANVTVAGPGLVVGATLDVAGDLLIGRNTSAGTAAGTGTLNVTSSSLVEATGVTIGTGGALNQTGGTLRINGGSFTGHADPLAVTGTGGPTLQLSNGLSKTLTPAGALALVVGDDTGAGTFSGTLRIDSGADLILSGVSKDIHIGDDAGTTGTITVEGVGSRLVADQPGDDLRVGNNGHGMLNINDGAQVLARNVLVPALSTGIGELFLNDTNATLTTANLTVGHASGTGSGTVVDDVTTSITATDPGTSVVIRSTGLVAITGQLNAAGTILLAGGDLDVHGTVTAGTLVDVDNGGRLRSGAGATTALVDGPVRVRAGGLLEASADDLTVGDAASADGFIADDASLISVGARTLTIHDADRALTHVTTINGGEIVAPNGMQIITAGVVGTLDGTGTITTSELFMDSGGSVITATGASGITINGKFRNNSGMIDGTKYTFNQNPNIADSGWTGAGTIDARVVFNSGTSANALANMTMGLNVTDGVTFNLGSSLHANARTVTLIDSNGVGLPSVTDMDTNGEVVCTQPLTVNSGRRISGRGDVTTPTLTVFGRISPGELTGVVNGEVGELTINGNLTLGGASDTDIELDGVLPGDSDSIDVNGALVKNGDLNISLLPGYMPSICDQFVLFTYNSRSGAFANVNFPPAPAGGKYILLENVASIRLMCTYIEDLDGDGAVGQADLAQLLSVYNTASPDGDITGDGFTGQDDLAALLANYNQSCPIP